MQDMEKAPKSAQRNQRLEVKDDTCRPAHNEYICHRIGEKRHNYLREIKRVVDKMDSSPCPTKQMIESNQGSICEPDNKPIINYPGYANIESPKFKQKTYVPLITNVPIKETRPTSEMKKHRHEQSYEVSYIPIEEAALCKPWAIPRKKSYELRGGIMYKGCQCPKHNGLQDRCERTECNGKKQCLTQPEPSCAPSQGFLSPKPFANQGRQKDSSFYCCCRNPITSKMIDGKMYPDCNHVAGPGYLETYRCRSV
ncbi:hypothetical protein O3M35_000529 [Rhynocoris fuscipes]|uniref:Uncharacterized protein n=1 Tax=Rhynocoris fuscipes TaxID=488301 RepID=A0AAW1DM31_9HEMI